MNYYKEELIKILNTPGVFEKFNLNELIEEPKDKNNGDFSLPCFSFSKVFSKSPNDFANSISEKIKDNKIFNILVVGPFLNFKIKTEFLFTDLENYEKNLSSLKKIGCNKKILLEYSSPNTNKAQHLGHLRNNVLGVCLTNVLKTCGYNVVTSCMFNDKGTAVAKTIYGYIKFGNNSEPKENEKHDKFVGNFYVLASQYEKENKDAKEEINEINRKWEAGDKEIIKIWKKLTDWVYDGYNNTYKKLGCNFDKKYYESEIFKYGKEIVLKGLEDNIFKKSEGAIISNLEKYNLPDTVLLKTDGTSLYITQDLYLAKLRNKEIKPEKTIYIVANEQNLHFKQLFSILEQLKIGKKENYFHLNYGYISLPTGRMKSREGTVVDAEDLIDEVIELAKSKEIGLGALRFQLLKVDAFSDFIFDPTKSVELTGDTSVYIQYTYARISSVLNKAQNSKIKIQNLKLLEPDDSEINLMRELNSYNESIIKVLATYNPSYICKKLLDISNAYNNFYQKNRIIDAEKDDVKNFRLFLSIATRDYIKHGLNLLEIETLEKM